MGSRIWTARGPCSSLSMTRVTASRAGANAGSVAKMSSKMSRARAGSAQLAFREQAQTLAKRERCSRVRARCRLWNSMCEASSSQRSSASSNASRRLTASMFWGSISRMRRNVITPLSDRSSSSTSIRPTSLQNRDPLVVRAGEALSLPAELEGSLPAAAPRVDRGKRAACLLVARVIGERALIEVPSAIEVLEAFVVELGSGQRERRRVSVVDFHRAERRVEDRSQAVPAPE